MRSFKLFMLATVILCSCTDDPTDPADQSTGVLEGNVEVYDSRLQRSADASGVLVRFSDSDGKKFETTTHADGRWEIALPFGVYTLDTMQHPTLMQLNPGVVQGFNGSKGAIDWLGKGRRMYLQRVQYCPETLDTIVRMQSHSVTIDSTYTPGYNDGHGHNIDPVYKLTVRFNATVETSLIEWHNFKIQFMSTSGKVLRKFNYGLNQKSTTQVVTLEYTDTYDDFTGLDNAIIVIDIESTVKQLFPVRRTDDLIGWDWNYRQLPIPVTHLEFPLK